MLPPAVTSIFDLLTPKSNQHIYIPKHTGQTYQRPIGWNSLHWFLKYGVHMVVFGMHILTLGQADLNTKCLLHQTYSVAEATTAHCFNLLTSKWRFLNFYFMLRYLWFNIQHCPHDPDTAQHTLKSLGTLALNQSDYYYYYY